MTTRRLAAAVLVLLVAFAGCLAPRADEDPADATPTGSPTPTRPTATPPASPTSPLPVIPTLPPGTGPGEMTAEERTEEEVVGCDGRTCVVREVRVAGRLTFDRLEIGLETFNGDVVVEAGVEDQWEMVARLEGRGATEEEARAKLDGIRFSWGHTDGARHFVEATASSSGSDASGKAATIRVKVPPSLVGVLTLVATNGDAIGRGIATDGAALHTTNGEASLDGAVTQVDLRSTNGACTGTLRPSASGRISAQTVNGQIELALVEDPQRGYDLVASTVNGAIEIGLRDGETSSDQTTTGGEKRFKTTGYDSRAIRTTVELTSTNGQIRVDPAL